jgi:hypothetical protein
MYSQDGRDSSETPSPVLLAIVNERMDKSFDNELVEFVMMLDHAFVWVQFTIAINARHDVHKL